jgi:hypothetical protein
MLFDCFISLLYMRVLKLTFGKNIFLHIFLKFHIFKCEAFGRTYSSSRRELAICWPSSCTSGHDLYRNTTSSGSQHSDWQMHPKVLGFDTWRISVPLFWATCRLFSILLLLWILESFFVCGYYYSVYPCTSETLRGSNCCVVFSLLYFTLCPFVTKRGSNFW